MKAAVVKALGTPPVYADFPDPQDGDGAVVATVEAAALKNLDRVMVSGKHYSGAHLPLPMVAGVDGVAAATVITDLMNRLRPQLEAAGDWDEIAGLTRQARASGTSAGRQRESLRRRGRLSDVVDQLIADTAAV